MAEAGDIVGPVRIHQRIDLGQFVAASDDDRSRPPTCRAAALRPAARGWWCRNPPSPAAWRPCPRACGSPRCWDRSLQKCGRECGSAGRARNGADATPAAPPRSRRRHRSRRRSPPVSRRTAASAMRLAAASICGHGVGIGHHLADGRIEKVLDRVDLDVAPGQHPRQHFRQLIALHDRQRPRRAARIEPVAPQFSGRRTRDTEKRRRRFDRQCGCGERHDASRSKRDGHERQRQFPLFDSPAPLQERVDRSNAHPCSRARARSVCSR